MHVQLEGFHPALEPRNTAVCYQFGLANNYAFSVIEIEQHRSTTESTILGMFRCCETLYLIYVYVLLYLT
jgi:hypothetical protein